MSEDIGILRLVKNVNIMIYYKKDELFIEILNNLDKRVFWVLFDEISQSIDNHNILYENHTITIKNKDPIIISKLHREKFDLETEVNYSNNTTIVYKGITNNIHPNYLLPYNYSEHFNDNNIYSIQLDDTLWIGLKYIENNDLYIHIRGNNLFNDASNVLNNIINNSKKIILFPKKIFEQFLINLALAYSFIYLKWAF